MPSCKKKPTTANMSEGTEKPSRAENIFLCFKAVTANFLLVLRDNLFGQGSFWLTNKPRIDLTLLEPGQPLSSSLIGLLAEFSGQHLCSSVVQLKPTEVISAVGYCMSKGEKGNMAVLSELKQFKIGTGKP